MYHISRIFVVEGMVVATSDLKCYFICECIQSAPLLMFAAEFVYFSLRKRAQNFLTHFSASNYNVTCDMRNGAANVIHLSIENSHEVST